MKATILGDYMVNQLVDQALTGADMNRDHR